MGSESSSDDERSSTDSPLAAIFHRNFDLSAMGNSILKDYDVEEAPFGAGGFRGMWLLYRGVDKNTGENVCIHILHKSKVPPAWSESIVEVMKRDAMRFCKPSQLIATSLNSVLVLSLMRLRHPYLLRVLHPLDESRR